MTKTEDAISENVEAMKAYCSQFPEKPKLYATAFQEPLMRKYFGECFEIIVLDEIPDVPRFERLLPVEDEKPISRQRQKIIRRAEQRGNAKQYEQK